MVAVEAVLGAAQMAAVAAVGRETARLEMGAAGLAQAENHSAGRPRYASLDRVRAFVALNSLCSVSAVGDYGR